MHLCEFYTLRGCAVGSGTGAGTGAFGPCGGIVPHGKNTGLAHTFATAADKTAVRRVLAVLAAVLCVGMAALGGWALVLAALAVLWRYHAVSRKQFGGITGDLAGWFLQKAELWMLAALCACQWGGLL